jgi:signal transduction histidine kinase
MMQARALMAVTAALLLLLTFLAIRAAGPDTARHERTLEALRAAILNEAALQRDVLEARAGLQRNYDPLVGSLENLRGALDDLRLASKGAPDEVRAMIDRQVEGVAAAVGDQEALVEQFKSRNALLQNSLIFFMHATGPVQPRGGAERDAVTAELGTLTNAMLRFTADPRAEAATEVTVSLDRLARLPVDDTLSESIRNLDAHGHLIVATLPSVNDLVARLLAVPMAERTRALESVYLDWHERAATRADVFRILLYVAALALALYVGFLFLRLCANARALQARVEFEHLLAAVSAQFIHLPRDQIDAGVAHGLARLGEHMAADRADIFLRRPDEEGLHGHYAWRRAGIDAPPPSAATVSAVAVGLDLADHERAGCLQVPDVARMPIGAARAHFERDDIRSWLSTPMGYAGRQVGLLALTTTRSPGRWTDDDIALLRMAGEVLTTAIERQRIESEQEALEARLHQAQRLEAVGTLAGGIAHEFNNILGAIVGHGEMALAAPLDDGRRVRRHVERIMRAAERARSVIDQVLTFSRRRERRRRPVAVAPAAAEAIELLRASLRAPDAMMRGDPTELQQIVMNLCTNAAHAMEGRGAIAIDLDTVELDVDRALSHGQLAAGRYVRLAVSDSGPGIDATTMRHMFEPFFTTKAVGRGTGLGLATVHGIVAAHHGAIHVESTPGRGTRFEVYLPQTEERTAQVGHSPPPPPPGSGQTILLVDDESDLVLVGEEMLAALGYEAVGFDDSTAALASFRADPDRFDLVLTDEVMPHMTGTELTKAMHRLRPDLPVVLMTGYAGPVELDRVQSAGVSDVLKKPLRSTTIAACLARHLH